MGQQHVSKLEYGALCHSDKGIARQAKWHLHRTVALVDSLALMHAVRKGRSSGPKFWFGSHVLAPHLLAAELQLHIGYIPTAYNPSDEPSRGARGKGGTRGRHKQTSSHASHSFIRQAHLAKRCHRTFLKNGFLPGKTRTACSTLP